MRFHDWISFTSIYGFATMGFFETAPGYEKSGYGNLGSKQQQWHLWKVDKAAFWEWQCNV